MSKRRLNRVVRRTIGILQKHGGNHTGIYQHKIGKPRLTERRKAAANIIRAHRRGGPIPK